MMPSTFSVTGSISGSVLTVTAVESGVVMLGTTISGTGIAPDTQIVALLDGKPGGIGIYSVSGPEQTVASTIISGTSQRLPVTAEDVISWFTDAGRADGLTSIDADVMVIVHAINVLQMLSQLPPVGNEEEYDKVRWIRRSLSDLREHLPWLVDRYKRRFSGGRLVMELPEAALLRQLKNIIDVLWSGASGPAPSMPARYLFSSRQGRKSNPWKDALVAAIERAWRSEEGRHELSVKPEGPFVKVVRRAFKAIDGKDHKPGAVASFLRERRR
jgi:hypothetical protein